MNCALRKALDDISGDGESYVPDHHARLEKIRESISHDIKFIGPGKRLQRCFQYALDIDPDLVLDSSFEGELFKEFIVWYCNNKLTKDRSGEIVVYFCDDEPKHIGVGKRRIISKWGLNPIYEHEIMDVPLGYGNKVEVYRRPTWKEPQETFISFVRTHHMKSEKYSAYKDSFESRVIDLNL